METSNNNCNYKVSITSWNQDVGCWLSVQENVNGQFGRTEKLFLPAYRLEGKTWHEVLRMATETLDKGEFSESDIQSPQTPALSEREESMKENEEERENTESYEDYPTRFEGIKEAVVSLFKKSRPVLALVGVILGLVFLISMQSQKEMQADKIAQLNSEITDIRKERESTYSQCTAKCDASREVYDSQVILKKKQIKEIELSGAK